MNVIVTVESPSQISFKQNSDSNDHASSQPWAHPTQAPLLGSLAKDLQRRLVLLSHLTDRKTEACRTGQKPTQSVTRGSRPGRTSLGGGDSPLSPSPYESHTLVRAPKQAEVTCGKHCAESRSPGWLPCPQCLLHNEQTQDFYLEGHSDLDTRGLAEEREHRDWAPQPGPLHIVLRSPRRA